MLNTKYSEVEVREKRNRVYNEFIKLSSNIKSGIITQISTQDLKLLFELYDSIFLNGYFEQKSGLKLKFSLSKRMTKSAGKTMYQRNLRNMKVEDAQFEIRMATDFFFRYYEISRDKLVNGIRTKDSLEAFQLVFEHEICHLMELLEYKASSCSGVRFKTMAHNIFGHKSSYHELPTSRETASIKYGFRVGDEISFVFEDKKYEGLISNINKRATVMVRDSRGKYVDTRKRRYTKYYVPLDSLIK